MAKHEGTRSYKMMEAMKYGDLYVPKTSRRKRRELEKLENKKTKVQSLNK